MCRKLRLQGNSGKGADVAMKIYLVRLNDMYVASFSGDVDALDVLKHVKLAPAIENAKIFDEQVDFVARCLAATIKGELLVFEKVGQEETGA